MIAAITAGLVNAGMSIVAKLTSEALFSAIGEKVLIHALKALAKNTKNSLDDEIVADVIKKLKK